MPGGFLTPGQAVGNQAEDAFTAAQFVAGASPTGGGKLAITNIPIGSVAYGSLGTNTADIAGQWWFTDIFVPFNRTVTSIGVLQGGTATTDNIRAAIWDSYGRLVCASAAAGVLLATASTFKACAIVLDANAAAITSAKLFGPQRYIVGVQGNGTAAGAIRTVATLTYIDILGEVLAGTFGTTPATVTLAGTFTAGAAPIVSIS